MNFIDPIKYGKLTDESSKTYTYTPEADDSIVAPFDGVVTLVDKGKCDGFIQISHLINGKVFYSEICGANKNIFVFVGGGMDVKKGQTIATCGGKNVTFEIKDGNKDKISISPFMIGLPQKQKDDTQKKKEPEKEKENTNKKKEFEKNKEVDSLNKKEKKGWDLTTPKDPKELPNLFTSLMLTPFAFIEKGLKPKKKENYEEDEKLNEEIQKIKKMIK
jgi:hypothetical protein